jgi:DNA adenine methylase
MLEHITSLLPPAWDRYFEPMAGGAALFFRTCPIRATIADINPELINFYTILRESPELLVKRLVSLRASRDLYYALRQSAPTSALGRAVRFVYLNRLAWNGLYRVNRDGKFNVPIGDRLPTSLWDFAELRQASAALSNATLRVADFAHVLRYAREGDFVFLDPPYPRGATDAGFNRYASAFFTSHDHRRLSLAVERLSGRGVMVMLALADRTEFRQLYPRKLRSEVVRSKALMACNGHHRRDVAELLLLNY